MNVTSHDHSSKEIRLPSGRQEYDAITAYWLAECSRLSYETDLVAAVKQLNNIGFSRIIFFDNKGTQAFLAHHPGRKGENPFAVLAFRGTEKDFADILTDINIFQGTIEDNQDISSESINPDKDHQNSNLNKKVNSKTERLTHRGFFNAFHDVWSSKLPKEMKKYYPNVRWFGSLGISDVLHNLPKNITLYVTGHSLGGALATLAAFHAKEYHSDVQLYTFGSPRVVNQAFAQKINQRLVGQIYRVVNHVDIVPRIPALFGYHHVGQLIYFNKLGVQRPLNRRELVDLVILLLAPIDLGLSILTGNRYRPVTTLAHAIKGYSENLLKTIPPRDRRHRNLLLQPSPPAPAYPVSGVQPIQTPANLSTLGSRE
ncbi:MAG: lipase family protein [Cyanobacteria bacterium CRU_2_1]|nr:lipase family protein [Cyanobacteria bacterium RU_5_0]NJR61055.1 lipase family protein [Cyanobacteria bacterium CRU_2_1]